MRTPFRGRKSLRDTLRQNKALFEFRAAARDRQDLTQPGGPLHIDIAPARTRQVRRPVDGELAAPLEKDIQKAILQAIALRRDVVFVGRFNRGQAVATNGNGDVRYTPFNSVPGFPDIHGLLVGGKAFYIEVKRPPPHYRKPEPDQQRFLDEARVGGAFAGVACSVDEALALLP